MTSSNVARELSLKSWTPEARARRTAKGKTGRPRLYPKCIKSRHTWIANKCKHCGITR